MSEAVKAAIAARRAAALRSNSASATSPVDRDDTSISTLGSPRARNVPRPSAELAQHAEAALAIVQKPLDELLLKSCTTGRLLLSSRAPPLQSIPSTIFSLLADEAPSWYSGEESWYERQDLTSLVLSTNEIAEVPARLSEFAMLAKLELHSNRISTLPTDFQRFSHLSHLNLSRNGFTSVPSCILALDALVALDLSHNRLESLWSNDEVLTAREGREKLASDNDTEEGGIWAGLIARSGSPTKREPPKGEERVQPLRGLRTLNLSDNKLANTALGLPAIGFRKIGQMVKEPESLSLPPLLVTLDLSNNALRGPLPLDPFAALGELKSLSLAGNGIADEVFAASSSSASNPTLSTLQILDLQRCEIDDLIKLEAFFGSDRIERFNGQDRAAGKVTSTSFSGPPSLVKRQLVRTDARQSDAQFDADKLGTSESGLPLLNVILEGNPLREEAFRRKRGPNSPVKATFTKALPATNPSLPARPPSTFPTAPAEAFAVPSRSFASPASSSSTPTPPMEPTKAAQPSKDDWDPFAYVSEGAKRRMRAEQARREREEAAAEGSAGGAEAGPSVEGAARGRNGTRRGINTTGLSDWDGEPVPLKPGMRGNRDRGTSATRSGKDDDEGTGVTSDEAGEGADGNASGSALANAKLSTKKKEALSQVPCKFYRSNGCSAGAACPFAHVLPGEGAQKATCQWFLKGSCRFGHKCALAHVLPGEPIAMDRKNKRAAQQSKSRNGEQSSQQNRGQGQGQGQGQGTAQMLRQSQGQSQGADVGYGNRADGQQNRPPGADWDDSHVAATGGLAAAMRARQQGHINSQHRDQDFPFGLPDDMLPSQIGGRGQQYSSSIGIPQSAGADQDIFGTSIGRDISSSQHVPFANGMSGSTSQRPLSVPRQGEARNRMSIGMDASHHVGSPTSRAFGTSPFSQPGGPSLFFSGSQDSEGGAGRFSRPNLPPSAHSMGQLDDVQARARWFGVKGAPPVEASDDFNEEDFLPSSLSDLLTPAELERRRRNSRPGPITRASTQSMPVEAGANVGSMWDLNLRNTTSGLEDIGLAKSNSSMGFASSHGHYAGRISQGIDGQTSSSTLGINRAGAFGSLSITNGTSSFSPGAQAALQHAPGQSLPQGLAAGLSRLHLQSARADALAVGSNHTGGRTDASASIRASLNASSHMLNTDELGPTAPASILAHRPSPLSLAAARSQGKSYGAHFGTAPLSSSASSPHFGTSPYSASSGHGFGGMTHLTSKRPDMDRVRSGAPPPGSPLAVPTMEENEMEDEPMFELE